MLTEQHQGSESYCIQLLEILHSLMAYVVSISLFTSAVFANPQDGIVTHGDASIHQSPNNTEIHQNSSHTIIEWHSFNVGAEERVHFQQPTGGVALNRINPAQGVSQIYGQISATGKIILVNQAGIFFGTGSYVNVGGI